MFHSVSRTFSDLHCVPRTFGSWAGPRPHTKLQPGIPHESTKIQLKCVLTQPKNALLKQYRYLFALNNVDFVVTNDAVCEVACVAIKKRTGARALRNILENLLLEAMYQAPEKDVTTVLVDAAAVLGKEPVKLYPPCHERFVAFEVA